MLLAFWLKFVTDTITITIVAGTKAHDETSCELVTTGIVIKQLTDSLLRFEG